MTVVICGGARRDILPAPPESRKYEEAYRAFVPFKFKWRAKLGKAVCDCTRVIETYQPWYGFYWSHAPECAIRAHLKRYPCIENLPCFWERDPREIAHSE